MKTQKIYVSTSPFLHGTDSTPRIMKEVILTLVPMMLASFYFFGIAAFLVSISAIAGCLVTEYVFSSNPVKGSSLKDGSAVLTGILLALCLPPGFPLWMAFLGGVVAIGMGKIIWGGLGQNVFNPALVGRAFLQAAFPTAITTWSLPNTGFFSFKGTNAAIPFYQGVNVDAVTSATPLAQMKFEQTSTPIFDLLIGNTGGSLGETSAILFLIAGVYMIIRKIIDWRIPVAILSTVFLLSGIVYLVDPDFYPSPFFMMFSGGLMLGTFYMATDLVTSPLTPKGLWWYGFGIGAYTDLGRFTRRCYVCYIINECHNAIN